MSKKLLLNETLSGNTLAEQTGTLVPGDKMAADVTLVGGTSINPLAKYVEATYSSGDTVVTYSYYESIYKVTSYGTITVTYTEAQDTTFTSAEWS